MNSAVLMLPWANCAWIDFAKSKNAVSSPRISRKPSIVIAPRSYVGKNANRFAGSPPSTAGASAQSPLDVVA